MTKFSARANVIVRRTYSRPKENGEFETWDEIVARVLRHQRWLWQRALGDVPLNAEQETELAELGKLLLERKVMVSGRTLWLGGTEVSKRRESSMFNCAFTKVETVNDVVDSFWLLLQGCGVGFEPIVGTLNGFTKPVAVKVIRSERDKLEQKRGREHNVEEFRYDAKGYLEWRLSVGDSAEAWAKAVGKLLAQKRKADILVLDFSQIRPAGERLKGYGWISSGDATFWKAMVAIADIMNNKAGQLLSRMDILDVMNHLGTTLSSRRSAEIALVPYKDAEWLEFAEAKKEFWLKGNEHRQQSNNSLMFATQPDTVELSKLFDMMQQAGGSEPGFINIEAARKRAPWISGVNPCVPGETLILTREGYVPIQSLVGQEVEVWNGEAFSQVTPFSTGFNPLVDVKLSDGTSLNCTPYHQFVLAGGTRVMAEELQPGDRLEKYAMPVVTAGQFYAGDAYSQGFYSGDGNADMEFSWLYAPKYVCEKRLVGAFNAENATRLCKTWKHGPMRGKSFVPVDGELSYCVDWLAGLLDADGTVTRDINGNGLQISAVDKEFLLNVRLMLTRMGVRAKVVGGAEAGYRPMPDGKGGTKDYFCRKAWRLLIGNWDTWHLIKLGLKMERLEVHGNRPQRDARRFVTVESVTPIDGALVETFCFTEPVANRGTFNGIVTGQCAEILLPNKGFCNLVEVNLAAFNGKLEKLVKAIRLIARANYRQTCVNLDDGILQRAWHQNNEFLRLCGVGMTGIVGWEFSDTEFYFVALRHAAREAAEGMAQELGLPEPKATTTIKPSGTLSKIMDTTEGLHKPLGKYIFNNIRFSRHDAYVEKLKAAGYRVFDDPTSPDAVLVTFPVKYDNIEFDVKDGKALNLESAVSQLERYKLVMQNYVDHNCSVTISYSPDEVPEIVNWLAENWDVYVGVSFLYRTDPSKTAKDLGYLYLPQEVVDNETYDEYVRGLAPLRVSGEGAPDMSPAADELEMVDFGECATGACPVR